MIISVHNQDPGPPLDPQRPGLARYQVGSYWVDAIGGEPTLSEVDAFIHPPLTIPQEIAAMLAEKGVTREDVWNCILASNAYCQAQATATGQPLATVTAYNRSKNKFFRECELLEAAIRAKEVLL